VKGLIDISPALAVGMGVFPGDAAFEVSQTFAIGPGCPVNVARIAMSTHCGAHADAPLHYDAAGASIDQVELADFIGPARVIDARGSSELCQFDDIAKALDGAPPRDHQGPSGRAALARVVLRRSRPELEEHLLGDLLGLGRVAQHGRDLTVDRLAELPVNQVEGAVLSASHGSEQ